MGGKVREMAGMAGMAGFGGDLGGNVYKTSCLDGSFDIRMLDEYDEFFRRFLLDRKETVEKMIADAEQQDVPVGGYAKELLQVTEVLAKLERLEALEKLAKQHAELVLEASQKFLNEIRRVRARVRAYKKKYENKVLHSKLRPKPFWWRVASWFSVREEPFASGLSPEDELSLERGTVLRPLEYCYNSDSDSSD